MHFYSCKYETLGKKGLKAFSKLFEQFSRIRVREHWSLHSKVSETKKMMGSGIEAKVWFEAGI